MNFSSAQQRVPTILETIAHGEEESIGFVEDHKANESISTSKKELVIAFLSQPNYWEIQRSIVSPKNSTSNVPPIAPFHGRIVPLVVIRAAITGKAPSTA